MKKNKKIIFSLLVFFGLYSGGFNVLAQEEATVSLQGEEVVQVQSTEADKDNNISTEILGVGQPKILPTSGFYFFKELGRGVGDFFAFSSEKKAERQLQHAAERLAEVKVMLQNKGDEKQNQEVIKSLQKYQANIENADQRIKNIQKTSDAYNNLLDKAVDKYAAFAKVMSSDEDLALDINKDIVSEIYKGKGEVLSNLSDVIGKLEKPAEALEQALQNQDGSDFKEFKNLEVLKELESKLPEQAAETVRQVQDRIRTKMEEKLSASVEGKTGEDFANYVISLKGSQAQHMAILDELSKSQDIPDEVLAGFREAKEQTAINFSKQMMDHPASEQMIEEIASGDIDKLRVLEEMADALPDSDEVKIKLEAKRDQAISKAVEKMSKIESVDDKISFLIRDGVPDAKSFVILDQLQAKFSPEQQEQVSAIRNKAFSIFSDIVDNAENREKLMSRLTTYSPKDLDVIAAIRENLPVEVAPKFDELAKEQMKKVEERLQQETNIERLIELRAEIDKSPVAQEMIKKFDSQMMERVNNYQIEKIQSRFQEINNPIEIMNLAREYNDVLGKYPEVQDSIKKNNPELINQLAKAQSEKIKQYLSGITDPVQMQKVLQDMNNAGLDKFEQNLTDPVRQEMQANISSLFKEAAKKEFLEKIAPQIQGGLTQEQAEKLFEQQSATMFSGDKMPTEEEINKMQEQMSTQFQQQAMEQAQQQATQEAIQQMPAEAIEQGAAAQVQEQIQQQIKTMQAPPTTSQIEAIKQQQQAQMEAEARAKAEEAARQQAIQQQMQQVQTQAPTQTTQPTGQYTQPPTQEQINQMMQQQAPSQEEIQRMMQEQGAY